MNLIFGVKPGGATYESTHVATTPPCSLSLTQEQWDTTPEEVRTQLLKLTAASRKRKKSLSVPEEAAITEYGKPTEELIAEAKQDPAAALAWDMLMLTEHPELFEHWWRAVSCQLEKVCPLHEYHSFYP